MTINHEKFDVYNLSIDFVGLADDVVKVFPRNRKYLADQLLRASTSISLNIAEGADKISKGSKGNYYSIAKGSVSECAAIFDICIKFKIIEEQQYKNGKEMLSRLTAMLTSLMKSLE